MAFTFFFRDLQTLNYLRKYMIPEVKDRRKVRIWDAGCAMGPEPFTLALILAEELGHFGFRKVHIDATDIDESNQFEPIITSGVFPEEQVKRIPEEIFGKYFHEADKPGHFQLDSNVRSRVEFHRHNLLTLQPVSSGYSAVLCKNVLLHFQYEDRVKVIQMFYDTLEPGGFLAMEQTQKLPEEHKNNFEQVANNVQIFKKI